MTRFLDHLRRALRQAIKARDAEAITLIRAMIADVEGGMPGARA